MSDDDGTGGASITEQPDEFEDDAGDSPSDANHDVFRRVSELEPEKQFKILKGWWDVDQQHSEGWRLSAEEYFAFVAGHQLSPEDKELLDSQGRPHVVFNRALTIIKAVCGFEINGRHEIQFLPVNTQATEPNEVLTAGSKWMAGGCDAEDEESQAFDQSVISGMGWVETRYSYLEGPRGKYIEEMVDCREMYWDRTAKKKNLSDARRLSRVRKMPIGDAMQMFPGKSRTQLDASWAVGVGLDYPLKSIEEKRIRDGNTTDDAFDDNNEVAIVCMQWWEREPYWLAENPDNGSAVELDDDDYQKLKLRMGKLGMPPIRAVQLFRKSYQQAFLGGEILKEAHPAPLGDQFSWVCITGEKDQSRRWFFGLVQVMKDPQMWANRFLSQTMQIMNATAKGGIMAEPDAFDDQRQAEDSYADPAGITWLSEGAISDGDQSGIAGATGPKSAGHS